MSERVQVFAEGVYALGTLRWGWQCSGCGEEETGFGSATTAAEGSDSHAATCVTPPEVTP